MGISEGLIYIGYAENPEKNHAEINIDEKLHLISCGLDYGSGSTDSKLGKTVLSAVGITEGFMKAYCLAESYFDGHFIPDRIIEWVIKFILYLKDKYRGVEIILNCEWASSTAINNALKLTVIEREIDVTLEDVWKSTILDRIDLVQLLLGEGRLLFTEAVPGIKAAFSTALWDEKKGKLKGVPIRLDNGTTDIDILDATEYALVKYTNYLMAAG
jgi:hypothetical protein